MTEYVDVLIVGAGISGIGAAYHLQTECPGRTFAIVEGRDVLGGTWDLFRYPGIRSDSDMYTLGYSFRPWTRPEAIADGPSILEYLQQTAREYGIDRAIRFRHWVKAAHWDSEAAKWTVEVEHEGETKRFVCGFLFMCAGYYDYDRGYTPDFEGLQQFKGRVVHPQAWTDDVEYRDKRVAVIGSGATAVTLVPALARKAAHVTMVQRTPSYVITRPQTDPVIKALASRLPNALTYRVARWKSVLLNQLFFTVCQKAPERMKKLLMSGIREQLGPDFDVDTHFNPPYGPWDQRLCLVPDADLFDAINDGRASVITDHIETFTERGLRLRSGKELEADLIVTATGLNVKFLGGIEVTIDGEAFDPTQSLTYRAMMLEDVPNLAVCFGYTNASWTLKIDLICGYVCRLLNHMEHTGHKVCTPKLRDPEVKREPFLALSSGYIKRAVELLPKQGSIDPWRVHQSYLRDFFTLRRTKVDDGVIEFS